MKIVYIILSATLLTLISCSEVDVNYRSVTLTLIEQLDETGDAKAQYLLERKLCGGDEIEAFIENASKWLFSAVSRDYKDAQKPTPVMDSSYTYCFGFLELQDTYSERELEIGLLNYKFIVNCLRL